MMVLTRKICYATRGLVYICRTLLNEMVGATVWCAWIGVSDIAQEGHYVDINGNPLTYASKSNINTNPQFFSKKGLTFACF